MTLLTFLKTFNTTWKLLRPWQRTFLAAFVKKQDRDVSGHSQIFSKGPIFRGFESNNRKSARWLEHPVEGMTKHMFCIHFGVSATSLQDFWQTLCGHALKYILIINVQAGAKCWTCLTIFNQYHHYHFIVSILKVIVPFFLHFHWLSSQETSADKSQKTDDKTLHGFPENGVFTVHVISFHCFALSMGNLMIHWWLNRGFSPPGLAGAGALRSEDGRIWFSVAIRLTTPEGTYPKMGLKFTPAPGNCGCWLDKHQLGMHNIGFGHSNVSILTWKTSKTLRITQDEDLFLYSQYKTPVYKPYFFKIIILFRWKAKNQAMPYSAGSMDRGWEFGLVQLYGPEDSDFIQSLSVYITWKKDR